MNAVDLDFNSPEIRHALDELDDAMFTAITGCGQSLARARQLWPGVTLTLGPKFIEESREQYLRYAVEVTQRAEAGDERCVERALAALEIIELLTRG